MEDHAGGKGRDWESDVRLQPKLLLMSGKMTERVNKMSLISFLKLYIPKYAKICGNNSAV